MLVYAMIRHWVIVVTGEEAEPEVFGRAVQWLAALFQIPSSRTDPGIFGCYERAVQPGQIE